MSEESSINQGVAKVFAGILAAIHGIVFFGAVYLLLQYNDRSGAIRRLLDAFDISFSGYVTIIGVALIFYILSVGAIATLIAMNENLRSIRVELANRRTTADVAESNEETANETSIETPSDSAMNRTLELDHERSKQREEAEQGADNSELFFIFALIVGVLFLAYFAAKTLSTD